MPSPAVDVASPTAVTVVYTPYASPIAPDFGRAFSEACLRDTSQSTNELRLATTAMVEQLKTRALRPEQVVIALKTALINFGGCQAPSSFEDEHESALEQRRSVTYRRVFTWCLDSYYGPASPT